MWNAISNASGVLIKNLKVLINNLIKYAWTQADPKDKKTSNHKSSVPPAPATETPVPSCHLLDSLELNQNDSDSAHYHHTGSQLLLHEPLPEQRTSTSYPAPGSATLAPAQTSHLLQTIRHSSHHLQIE